MKGKNIAVAAVCLTLVASGAFAAKRSNSQGTWCTGEFSEDTYATRWGYGATDQGSINKITADSMQTKTGKNSIKLDTTSGMDTWVYFPNTKDMDLDVSKLTEFKFSLRSENKNGWGGDPQVIFKDMAGRAAQFNGTGSGLPLAMKQWADFSVPLNAAAEAMAATTATYMAVEQKKRGPATTPWLVTMEPGFDWKHIASFEIHADTGGYGFIMWHDGVEFVGAEPVKWWLSSIEKPDLSVTWAKQSPGYKRYSPSYDNGYPELKPADANGKHWPDEGEEITYTVHIRNAGFVPSEPTNFTCSIDGRSVKTARIPAIDPRQETTVDVQWNWKQGPYKFVARVDTKGKMDEITKKNNTLTFNTDAYTLATFCEVGMTKQVDAVNNYYGSFSWEDWLRGATVDKMNSLFKHGKYDFAPKGAKISVRLDPIYVVDKITRRTQSSVPENGTFDGAWEYGSPGAMEYCNLSNSYMWALDHELTHQLGIIDDYQLDLGPGGNEINGKGFGQPDGGMMGGGHVGKNAQPSYSDIDIAGMNATYSKRRGFFGEYLYNVPTKNTLVLTIDGKPAANADVQVYQKTNGKMAGDPVFRGKTDAEGRFALANRPPKKEFTTATGCTLKPNPFGHIDVVGGNGLFLVRANAGGKWYYQFIDIGHFVCEYARGHKKSASYPLELTAE